MYSHPELEDRMVAEDITDNQGALMTAEKKRSVLSELLSPRLPTCRFLRPRDLQP